MVETTNNILITREYGEKDCSDPVITGIPSERFDFVLKPYNADLEDVSSELNIDPPCDLWYYYNMKVGSLKALEDVNVDGEVIAVGDVSSNNGIHVLSNKKNLPFDMPHPNKKGWRLRHVCIEGPEIAVYCRGKINETGIIDLPSFWDGLVNLDDMTINITPIGHWQELFVEHINKNTNQVIIKNNNGTKIRAGYHIIARRLDDDLIVEYQGDNYTDYPKGNEGYSFNYEHSYVENLIKEQIKREIKNASNKRSQ
jgi:hypothetical protein